MDTKKSDPLSELGLSIAHLISAAKGSLEAMVAVEARRSPNSTIVRDIGRSPSWKECFAHSTGIAMVKSLEAFDNLKERVAECRDLQPYFEKAVIGPLTGWGPVTPEQVAEHICRLAINRVNG